MLLRPLLPRRRVHRARPAAGLPPVRARPRLDLRSVEAAGGFMMPPAVAPSPSVRLLTAKMRLLRLPRKTLRVNGQSLSNNCLLCGAILCQVLLLPVPYRLNYLAVEEINHVHLSPICQPLPQEPCKPAMGV